MAVLASAAVWIDLGPINKFHNGDTIVPVLASLYKWTPFYWEQNRLGMFLALVASPFKHPMVNMLVQYGLAAWMGLSVFFLSARYVMGKGPWVAAGAIGAAICLVAGKVYVWWGVLMGHHEYGTSLALGLAGLLLLERAAGRKGWPSATLGGLCVLLASWVNMAVFATLLPLVVTKHIISRLKNRPPRCATEYRRQRPGLAKTIRSALSSATAWQVAALIASTAGVYALAEVVPYRSAYKVLPLREWAYTWLGLWQSVSAAFSPTSWLAGGALLGLCAAGVFFAKSRKDALLAGLAAAAPLLAGALGNCLLMGSLDWPRLNLYAYRYLIPSIVLLFIAAGAFGSAVVLRGLGPMATRIVSWLLVGGFAAAIVAISPAPSLARVRSNLDLTMGRLTQEVLSAKCTHIMGNYWRVWPGVFHANLVNYERGRRTVIWGIAHRCAPTRDLWFNVPPDQIRVAAIIGDEQDCQWDQMFYHTWPLVKESQLTKIVVYRPAQSVLPARPAGKPPPRMPASRPDSP